MYFFGTSQCFLITYQTIRSTCPEISFKETVFKKLEKINQKTPTVEICFQENSTCISPFFCVACVMWSAKRFPRVQVFNVIIIKSFRDSVLFPKIQGCYQDMQSFEQLFISVQAIAACRCKEGNSNFLNLFRTVYIYSNCTAYQFYCSNNQFGQHL